MTKSKCCTTQGHGKTTRAAMLTVLCIQTCVLLYVIPMKGPSHADQSLGITTMTHI